MHLREQEKNNLPTLACSFARSLKEIGMGLSQNLAKAKKTKKKKNQAVSKLASIMVKNSLNIIAVAPQMILF